MAAPDEEGDAAADGSELPTDASQDGEDAEDVEEAEQEDPNPAPV